MAIITVWIIIILPSSFIIPDLYIVFFIFQPVVNKNSCRDGELKLFSESWTPWNCYYSFLAPNVWSTLPLFTSICYCRERDSLLCCLWFIMSRGNKDKSIEKQHIFFIFLIIIIVLTLIFSSFQVNTNNCQSSHLLKKNFNFILFKRSKYNKTYDFYSDI